jgi:hypothetical protein
MPELAKCVEIANLAGVSVVWLLQGLGPRSAQPNDPLAEAVGHAVSALPASEGLEVADFVRYKLQRTTPAHVAMESKARYLAELDNAVQDRRQH